MFILTFQNYFFYLQIIYSFKYIFRMINVYNKLKNMKSKLILQVHDELLIETFPEEIEDVKKILKFEMENVIKLKVPLIAELSEGKSWYEAK